MSLFGALFTGVSGLSAQSQSIAMISNNIANVNTVGFKRSEASFFSLVTTESRSSRYSPGTVSTERNQRVDQQGNIQQTSSSTDAAISGNGFFVVRQDTDNPDQEFLYTRSGAFSEDAQGFLRNTAGYYLYGWPLDNEGNLPSAQGDLSSLVPVDVAFLGGLTRPTSTGELALNIDAEEDDIDTSTGAASLGFPIPTSEPPDFERTLRVFDSLGSSQDITFEFRKVTGPMASLVSTTDVNLDLQDGVVDVLPGTADGDTFTIAVTAPVPTAPITIELLGSAVDTPLPGNVGVYTVQEMLNAINNYGTGDQLEARLTTSGDVIIQTVALADQFTLNETTGTPLSGVNSLNIVPGVYTQALDVTAASVEYPNQVSDFPVLEDSTSPNTQGWWELKMIHPDGSTITEGLLNFADDGSINATPDSESEIDLTLQGIDWGNGSSLQDIEIDVSRFSQFAGDYNVIFSDQNGAELGLRTGVEIDRDGFVVARFSNGAASQLYKLPLVTFANPNGLTEVSGTAYQESDESGEENLREAGRGGAGFLESSTIEGSNVDIADEFATMIITQRAYSASTRVISTADEMTEDLLRLR